MYRIAVAIFWFEKAVLLANKFCYFLIRLCPEKVESKINNKANVKLGVVEQVFHLSTWEVNADRQISYEFNSLVYIVSSKIAKVRQQDCIPTKGRKWKDRKVGKY